MIVVDLSHDLYLVDILLKEGDHPWVVITDVGHLGREQLYDLAIGHLLVVMWVDGIQQGVKLLLQVGNDAHPKEQVLELLLTDYAVVICVELFEELGEGIQEFLMLLQLEVQDHLHEVLVEELSVVLRLLGKLLLFIPGELATCLGYHRLIH